MHPPATTRNGPARADATHRGTAQAAPDIGSALHLLRGGLPHFLDPPRVPLNALDELHALSETPSEPWSIHVEVRVDGRLEEDRLGAAVWWALQKHPLARARLIEDHKRLFWQIDPTPACEAVSSCRAPTQVQLNAIRSGFLGEIVPLTLSPPLRVRLLHVEDKDHLILNVHHAACDGLSALRLMQSIARAYGGERDPVFAGDARKEWRLEQIATPAAGPGLTALAGIERLLEALPPAGRTVPDGGTPGPGYGVQVRSLELTRILHSRVRLAAHASVNDILLTALHLAIGHWNRTHGVDSDRLAVIVPINVRGAHQQPVLVGNFTMSDIVSTRSADRRDPVAALQAVHRQTTRFKNAGAPLASLVPRCAGWPSRLDRRMPGLFRGSRREGPGECAVFSNLGRGDLAVASFGARLPVTGLWFSPPVTSLLGVGLGVVSHGDALHATLRYRRSRFDDSAAARLFQMIIVAIEALC